MLPITQALAARYVQHEAEGLHAVSTITPVDSVKPEVPLWNRLRQGMQFNGVVVNKESAQNAQAGLATFKVQVNLPGQPPQWVLMQLPEHTPQQQALQMQVLGAVAANGQPQVKWSAESPVRQVASAAVESRLGVDEDLSDAASLTQAGNLASEVDLSPPAKYLQRWLDSPLLAAKEGVYAQSVVSQHPEKSQVLAQDLKHAVDHSGLFYESHLREATLGVRPWQQLLQEPHNQPQFSAPEIVSQQLQVLEQQRMIWHGEVWPGQPMQWQVTERSPASKGGTEAASQVWFSNLKLTLPALGELNVRITMVDGKLSVRVQTEDRERLQTLLAAKQSLASSIRHAGLSLERLQISEDVIHASN